MALAAASCGIVLLTQSTIRSTNPVERLSLVGRLANASVSYVAYLGQSFLPVDLAPFYPHLGTRLPMAWAAEALVLLLAITAVAAYCWRRLPYLLVGWLWYLGMLVPVSGVLQIGAHARADRYTYLSQIGLSIAVAWCVWSFYRSRQSRQAIPWRRWTLAAVSGAAVLVLAAVAWRQTSYWRNPETLWTHTIAVTENNAVAHHNLGVMYLQQEKVDEAIAHLREAAGIDFFDPQLIATSHSVLADALVKQGKLDEAIGHYQQAVRLYPQGMIFHAQLAGALVSAGQFERAIAEWREAVRLAPAELPARLGLAEALLAHGAAGEAVDQCRQILDQKPNAIKVIVLLATALAAEGKGEEAIPPLKRALELEPDNAEAHFRLGLVLIDLGRSSGAVDQLNEAVRLQPDSVPMLWQTAWVLATVPDSSIRNGARAVELASRAVQLSNNREPHAFDALAAALAETKQFPAAIEAAERASTLALAQGDDALVDAIEQRCRLYRQDAPLSPAGRRISPLSTPSEKTD